MAGAACHVADVALFQLGHAATFGVHDLGLDAVVGEHGARRFANAWVVVVDETGGVEDGLAPGGGCVLDGRRPALRALDESVAVKPWQVDVAVQPGDAFE